MSKRTSVLVAGACILGALFFLSWAVQTAWIASFPNCNCPEFAYWFYLQLFVFLGLSVATCVVLWRAFRRRG